MAEENKEGKGDFSLAKKLLGRIGVNRAPEGPAAKQPPGGPAPKKPAGAAPGGAGAAPTARHQPGGVQPKMILNELVTAIKRWESNEPKEEPEGYDLIDDDRPGKQLRHGFEGRPVEALQRALKLAKVDCPQNGKFDDATDLAVKKFQKANGCDEKGIIGPRTLVALDKALGLPPRRRGPITQSEAAALREKTGDDDDVTTEGLPQSGNAFIDGLTPGAVRGMKKSGFPASVAIAIAVVESSWGTTPLARDFHNPYGIHETGPGGKPLPPSSQRDSRSDAGGGDDAPTPKRYASDAAAAEEFGALVVAVPKYKRALDVSGHVPERFAVDLAKLYSADDKFGTTLARIVKQFDLTRFDRVAGNS